MDTIHRCSKCPTKSKLSFGWNIFLHLVEGNINKPRLYVRHTSYHSVLRKAVICEYFYTLKNMWQRNSSKAVPKNTWNINGSTTSSKNYFEYAVSPKYNMLRLIHFVFSSDRGKCNLSKPFPKKHVKYNRECYVLYILF